MESFSVYMSGGVCEREREREKERERETNKARGGEGGC